MVNQIVQNLVPFVCVRYWLCLTGSSTDLDDVVDNNTTSSVFGLSTDDCRLHSS